MSEKDGPRLASALAQKVVDTIAPTINRHVNIMNAHGTIIASTDASRIGTHHAGSAEALRRNEVIRLTRVEEAAGTQPGVNVPLELDGRLCGVVGVTGAPHEVEPLAGLIALTVQLLFAQEREHSRSTRLETEARDIISALLAGQADPALIERSLEHHGLRGPKQLELWFPANGTADAALPPLVEGQRTSWTMLLGAAWRLRRDGGERAGDQPPGEDRYLASAPVQGAAELLAEAEALRVLAERPTLVPRHDRQGMWNREIALAIARTPQRSLEHQGAAAKELNAEQARTLLVVSAAPAMTQAAVELHIHRNTLVQRLERINQITGLDTRRASAALRLQHALYARIALGQLDVF